MIKYILHYAPAKVIPGLINFLGLTIYARIFTQAEYGRYAFVFATLTLVQSMLFPWIRMSIARFHQKYSKENKENEYENFTLFLFIVISLVLILSWSVFLTIFKIDPLLKDLYLLGLIVIISQALFEQLMGIARAKLQSKAFLFSMMFKAIIHLSLVLILVGLFNFNEKALFIGIIFAHVIPIIIYLIKHFTLDVRYFTFDKRFIKETFHYGIPLTFTFLLAFIISSSDRILIKFFLDEESVGLYSIPYDFSTFTLTNIFMVFSMAFFPIIVKELEHSGYRKAKERIEQYLSVMLTFVIPSTIFLVMFAPEIAGVFLGENYDSSEAILIIRLTSIAAFIAGLKAYFFDYAFQLGKNTYKQIIPVLFAAALNIFFNIILLPMIGVIGAVISTIISFGAGIIISIFIGRKLFKMTVPMKDVSKIIIINIVFIIGIIFIPEMNNQLVYLIVTCILAMILYILLMIGFNINNIREIIFRKIKNMRS